MDATTFPIPMQYHIVFVCIFAVFFLFQFLRRKRPYHIIMMVAALVSLTIYIGDLQDVSKYKAIGWVEAVLLAAALAASIFDSFKESKAEKKIEKTAQETEK